MSDEQKTTYRLYVLKPDADGLNAASQERFSRVNERYVLVYTDKTLQSAEITTDNIWRLNRAETEWLGQCNVQLLFEDAQRRKDEIQRNLSEKIKKLEEELDKQLQKAPEKSEI